MKKLIGWSMALLIAAIALTGCTQEEKHTHEFGKWKTVNEATCTEAGLRERKCECGEKESETLDAKGHSLTAGICLTCGYIDEQELLEFASMQFMEMKKLPDGTYSVSVKGGARSEVTALAIPGEYDGKKITAVAETGFSNCEKLAFVSLGEGITVLGKDAFKNCKVLEEVVLPSSLVQINDQAFGLCYKLKKLHIPAGVTKFGAAVLQYSWPEEITVDEQNTVFYAKDGCLIDRTTKTLVGVAGKFTIPADGSVTAIGDGAIRGASQLKELIIPEGVTQIGFEAIWGCNNLTDLYLPASLTKLGERMTSGAADDSLLFVHYNGTYAKWEELTAQVTQWCTGHWYSVCIIATDQKVHSSHDFVSTGEILREPTCTMGGAYRTVCRCGEEGEELIYTDGHKYADGKCLNCGEPAPEGNGLEFRLLEDGTWAVTGMGAFGGETLVIPATYQGKPVSTVGNSAFWMKKGFTTVIIEEGVRFVGDRAFEDVSTLVSVTLPKGLVSIGDSAFYGCNQLTTVYLPDGVESIGMSAFAQCTGLTELILPDSVTTLGANAFDGCSSLVTLQLSQNITEILGWTFSDCVALEELLIPASVTYIDENAFFGCIAKEFQILNPQVNLHQDAFSQAGFNPIRFNGTMEQWKTINAQMTDYDLSPYIDVICTDGVIEGEELPF